MLGRGLGVWVLLVRVLLVKGRPVLVRDLIEGGHPVVNRVTLLSTLPGFRVQNPGDTLLSRFRVQNPNLGPI